MFKIEIDSIEDLAKFIDFIFGIKDGKDIAEQIKRLEIMRVTLENAVKSEMGSTSKVGMGIIGNFNQNNKENG